MRVPEGYEQHVHKDPDFPIIFHHDYLKSENHFLMHWHENIEILYFIHGSAEVVCDTIPVVATVGDIAVVNSCALHTLRAMTPLCEYYCLIIDKGFCNEFDLPVGEIVLSSIVSNPEAKLFFDNIIKEMGNESIYYKTAVKAGVLALLTYLFRTAVEAEIPSSPRSQRLDMVRNAITYIRKHYREELSVEDICNQIGFSKFYFCRTFREITGKTVVNYVNYLRCDYARRLLSSGQCNVSESAERSGFQNLSYFSRTYKRHFGVLPSQSQTET